jgi:3-methyl-2-oxobutanoate hydroxymethyltransferase
LQDAGCYSIVLEGIPATLAAQVTGALSIPTIGIGAGPNCDGQVLVLYDLLGLDERFNPKFLKKYAHLSQSVVDAISTYRHEVRDGAFPALAHSHH